MSLQINYFFIFSSVAKKFKLSPSVSVEVGENFAGLSLYGSDLDGINYFAFVHADNESIVLMSRSENQEDGTWSSKRYVWRGDFEYKDDYLAYAKIYALGDLFVVSDGRYDLGIVHYLTAPAEQYGPNFIDLSYKITALLPEIPTYDYIRENSEFYTTGSIETGDQRTGSEFDVSGVEKFVGMSVEELQGWSPEGYSSSSTSDSKVDTVASEFITASTWSGDITIKSNLTAASDGGNLTAPQIDDVYKGWQGSILNGSNANDQIYCKAGWDVVDGKNGNDFIRAGNGRDVITGGAGRDELWGDFGWNTYTSSKDGTADLIVVKSDQLLYNWLYDKAENNPDGRKCDIIEGLDVFDQIKILGANTFDLSFKEASAHGVSGIGIYASGFLEALYTAGDMSIDQLRSITTGDASEAVMNNTIQTYNWI